MPIAQSKRKLIAATALFVAVGSLTGAIATGGPVAFAQTEGQEGGGGGANTQQQGGQGGRIVQQGTVTSEQFPLPGPDFEGDQGAEILPLMENRVYSGVLTFTSSEPVNVVILNVQQDLNQTEQAILNGTEDGEFGTLTTSQLDNQTSIALTIIPPTDGGTSASIPFTGNGVWLHTDGTPFAATYAVSAQTLQPEIVNQVSNATLTATEDGEEDEEEDGGAAADGGAGTNATTADGGDEGAE